VQATEGSAGDIFEEGKGNWNRECLKGMVGTEMFFSCSLNWFHEGIVEIFYSRWIRKPTQLLV